MKPFALGALCIGTLALGVSMVLLAMVLLKILPQGLVVLVLAALGLVILKVLIRILSCGLAVHSAPPIYGVIKPKGFFFFCCFLKFPKNASPVVGDCARQRGKDGCFFEAFIPFRYTQYSNIPVFHPSSCK